MDIASLSVALNQASVKQAASLATAKMAMNTVAANGEGLVALLQQTQAMQQSVQPHLGGAIDLRI